jgi:SAM-dependent methyltransferase
VTVVNADVCDPLPIEGSFDVVNAIGVMFHIVEDERWERAVANLAGRLAPDGVMIVGGQFGPVTHDVGFRRPRGDGSGAGRGGAEVLKRLRSRRRWQRCAAQAGLHQVRYVRTRKSREIDAPESNLLVFGRRDPGSRAARG